MSLVRYEPYSLLNQLQREFNRLGSQDVFAGDLPGEDSSDVAVSQWRPAVDIKEEQDRYVITADLPGVDGNRYHHGKRRSDPQGGTQ